MNRNLSRLRALYAELPTIDCKGLCSESCHFVGMTTLEHDHIEKTHGFNIQMTDSPCPALNFMGRCSVYEDRPMICRIWGVADEMRCPYGCKPETYLTREQGFDLLARARALSGMHSIRL